MNKLFLLLTFMCITASADVTITPPLPVSAGWCGKITCPPIPVPAVEGIPAPNVDHDRIDLYCPSNNKHYPETRTCWAVWIQTSK